MAQTEALAVLRRSRMLSVSCALAFAASLVALPATALPGTDGATPDLPLHRAKRHGGVSVCVDARFSSDSVFPSSLKKEKDEDVPRLGQPKW